MKTVIRFVMLPLMFMGITTQAIAKPVSSSTHEAITKIAIDYFNGMVNGDLDLPGEVFDMEYGDVKILDTDPDT